MSLVYIIASDIDGPVKVGISDNPDRRVRQLQTGNPHKLILFHTEEADDARVVEIQLHKNLRKRLVGEWFNIGVLEAVSALKETLIKSSPMGSIEIRYGLRKP